MVLMAVHSSILYLLAGILVLLMPGLLNHIVAICLIITGLLGLVQWLSHVLTTHSYPGPFFSFDRPPL
jgi:hypothetical protein